VYYFQKIVLWFPVTLMFYLSMTLKLSVWKTLTLHFRKTILKGELD